MHVSHRLRSLALSTALLLPGFAWAGTTQFPDDNPITLTPSIPQSSSSAHAGGNTQTAAPSFMSANEMANVSPQMLDDAAEKPNIHGFIESPFRTSYITPRGLVVEDQGLVWQPVAGMVLPIGDIGPIKNFALIAGVWNSVNTHNDDPQVGSWNEMDVFASFAGNVADNFSLTLTYGAWNFPESTLNKPKTEHNIDLKIAFDDSKMWNNGFSINPYCDIFWAVGGSSTVVLGRKGGTGYVEIGIVPTYKWTGIANYPVTFTMPTYFSVGPKDYWGIDAEASSSGNFGVLCSGIDASIPLAFIPARYGYWHIDAGVTYFNLLNGALSDAGHILSGNRERNLFQGEVGFGLNF